MDNKLLLTKIFEKYPKTVSTFIWILIFICFSLTFWEHSSSSWLPIPSFDFRYEWGINSIIAILCFIWYFFNNIKLKLWIIILCVFWILLFPLYNKAIYESIYWQYGSYTLESNREILYSDRSDGKIAKYLWEHILPDIWRSFLPVPYLKDTTEGICNYINQVGSYETSKKGPSDYVTGIKVALNQWNIDEVEKCAKNKEYFSIAKEYLTVNSREDYKLIAKFHYLYENDWDLEEYYTTWKGTIYSKDIKIEYKTYIKLVRF